MIYDVPGTLLTFPNRKNLEDSLAQLNTEHVEILVCDLFLLRVNLFTMFDMISQNELVKSRLRNEEIESELVRYKLL